MIVPRRICAEKAVAIETTYCAKKSLGYERGTFGKLAKFIGVFATPENDRKEAISMTAPVQMAPSLNDEDSYSMRFFLPKTKYGNDISNVPKPEHGDVAVVCLPEHVCAVRTFSGSFSQRNIDDNERYLRSALKREKFSVTGDEKCSVLGYNPPWTLPWFRTSEVVIPIGGSTAGPETRTS